MVAAVSFESRPRASLELTRTLWTDPLPRSHGFEPLAIEGTLPVDLRGTLYRNGFGQFGQFDVRYTHPLESDGAITAIRFEGGQAWGAAQLTPTEGLREEQSAGRMLYGAAAPWLRRMRNLVTGRSKNTANTNVIAWQGRLLALMEGGKPTELDPRDLSFRGETTLEGAIVSWFSAHPHRVAARRAIYNFGIEAGPTFRLHLYELPDSGPARHLGALKLDGAHAPHDFIATDTHLIFFLSPVRVDVGRVLFQVGGFDQLLQWRPELDTEIVCVPIDRPMDAVRFRTDPFYQWHFTNAFARGSELVVDYVRFPDFGSFDELKRLAETGVTRELAKGRAHRATVDLQRRTFRSELLVDRPAELPSVAPGCEGRDCRWSYLAMDELASIAKLEARTGAVSSFRFPDTQAATEPVFVPRSGATREDDGWLLTLVHDLPSRRACVVVLDAARIEEGPVARAWFDHHIPMTVHGTFAPGA